MLTGHQSRHGGGMSPRRILVEYLSWPDVKENHGITKTISEQTACHYLNSLGYQWSLPKKGQYQDGHEHADVVQYWNQIFILQWKEIGPQMWKWTKEDKPEAGPLPGQHVIAWFHDKTVFYAHDRCKKGWHHKDAPAKPYSKGEGALLMIANFVSSNFGWLQSPDASV